jgi:hypothetical protein
MDEAFRQIQNRPENSVFAIVFFPDRIYHAEYLTGAATVTMSTKCATRSTTW